MAKHVKRRTIASKEPWQVDVNDLVEAFRQGLVALVPIFEKAKIPWSADENYDDFDHIAEALYDSIIRDSIREAIGLEDCAPLQRYGFSPAADTSRLLVGDPADRRVFVSFVSRVEPFDHVAVRQIESPTKAVVPYRGGVFHLEARSLGSDR